MNNTSVRDTLKILESVKTRANLDESVLKALWQEIFFRNQNRVKAAIQKWESREKAAQKYPTMPLEDMLKKAQKEAA